MKVLLLQPPVQDFYDTDIRLQPLGLAYLKAAVHKYLPQVEVVIRDYHHGWGRRSIKIPSELAYLKDYYVCPDESPFSVFHHYYHFGADFEAIAEDVRKIRPNLVGISSLFSPYYREALECARLIKQRLGIPVLMGGSHVSAMPEAMLESPWVDFIIRGEGERAFVEFLKAFQKNEGMDQVPNLGHKKNGLPLLNPIEENYPIEELPIPDLSDFSAGEYLFERKPLSFLVTSRSCPHRCSFCSVHQTFGFRYRRRPVAKVMEEIHQRYQEGVRVFDFEDDNLTYYQKDMKLLCEELIKAFPEKDVQFIAMNGISYLSLNPELLDLMRRAGFTHLNLALVSSDTTVRETTKRPHTIEKYMEIVAEAARLGFKIVSYQILGLPNETLDSMIQTLCFEARLPVLLGASMFYMTPNSPIAKPFGTPSEEDVFKSRLTAMAIETENFKREDIFTLFVTTRILNFLKGFSFDEESLTGEAVLARLKKASDKRSRYGALILENLLSGQPLHALMGDELIPLQKFKTEIFFRVWNTLDFIGTQGGKRIFLKNRQEAEKAARVMAGIFPEPAL